MDETKEPRLPKRPVPAKARKPTKHELERGGEDLNQAALLLNQDEIAAVMLAIEFSKEQAAITMGWTLESIEEMLNQPHVKIFLKRQQDELIRMCARMKFKNMRKVGISQANVEQRLMELGQMDPDQTRGSIDGQVKALRTLAETMGMLNADDPLRGKSRQELEGYVSKAAHRLPAVAGPPVN